MSFKSKKNGTCKSVSSGANLGGIFCTQNNHFCALGLTNSLYIVSRFLKIYAGKIFLIISGVASRHEFLFVSILKIFLVFLTSGKKTQYILKIFSEKIKHSVKNQTFSEKYSVKNIPRFSPAENPRFLKNISPFLGYPYPRVLADTQRIISGATEGFQ